MSLSMKTILYAEDEEWLLEGITEGLRSFGYNVITATDGSKALDLFRARAIDLLLLDVMMPPGDQINVEAAAYGRRTGVEVCKIVHREKPNLPIICLTVVMDRKIHRELQELGAIVLEKPAVPSEIARRIAEKINR